MGEATLVRGEAYVALDSTFAAAIDPRSKYLVFLTPEGDSHGLFIAAQSGRGFAVHENGGARSTLAFNYRIVAKPYDTSAAPPARTRRASTAATVGRYGTRSANEIRLNLRCDAASLRVRADDRHSTLRSRRAEAVAHLLGARCTRSTTMAASGAERHPHSSPPPLLNLPRERVSLRSADPGYLVVTS